MSKLINQVQSFTRTQGKGGARGLALLLSTIEHFVEHNDWTPLTWLINKSDATDKTRYRAITGKVLGGVSLISSGKKASKQPSGMYVSCGDNWGVTEQFALLRQLVKDGESFRGNAVKQQLLGKEPAPFDMEKYARSIWNKLDKEHATVGQLMAAIGEASKAT